MPRVEQFRCRTGARVYASFTFAALDPPVRGRARNPARLRRSACHSRNLDRHHAPPARRGVSLRVMPALLVTPLNLRHANASTSSAPRPGAKLGHVGETVAITTGGTAYSTSRSRTYREQALDAHRRGPPAAGASFRPAASKLESPANGFPRKNGGGQLRPFSSYSRPKRRCTGVGSRPRKDTGPWQSNMYVSAAARQP